ncbi:MAG: 50S ribosomal protein L23 [Clostridia bacterium]|nr:50S ribosomal protein L23 [Clostridia bacterium]
MKFVQDIIIRPLITERSMDMLAQKKYSFEVAKDATKPEIAKAVETMFEGTKVKSVNTMNMKAKPKRLRYVEGKTASWKKAIVTLTEDSKTIEFFEGLN